MGWAVDATTAVVVAPRFTVSDRAALVDPASPDPLAGVNAAFSDSGELLAAKDVVHVAVPLGLNDWLAQPEITLPLAEKATVPSGAPAPLVVTVAVSVTVWLVAAGDGLGAASAVVVWVAGPTTVAVTLSGV
jgi:hypothetical protein